MERNLKLSAHEFYLQTNGKKIGTGQCGDLFSWFCQLKYGITPICQWTHGVIDFVNHFEELGLDKYFELINCTGKAKKEIKDGDWIVWKVYVEKNHISMARAVWKDNDWCINLTQNSSIPSKTEQMYLKTSHANYILRPKAIKEEVAIDWEAKYKELANKSDELIHNIKVLIDEYKEDIK